MDSCAIDPDSVLKNHGGALDKNFAKIVNEGSDSDEIELISYSPYYTPSHLPVGLHAKENLFAVLSLNSQSILAKFGGLQVMLELFATQNIHFPVICIQETWLQDETKLPLVSLNGYNCFYGKASTSSHGGLITYIDDKFEVRVVKTVDNSNIWEGLFLELKHGSLKNKITIGNIYKPPRDNNNVRNVNTFRDELEPILQELSASNNEVLLCGDYNINLLKLNQEAHYSEFFDTMLGHRCPEYGISVALQERRQSVLSVDQGLLFHFHFALGPALK